MVIANWETPSPLYQRKHTDWGVYENRLLREIKNKVFWDATVWFGSVDTDVSKDQIGFIFRFKLF
jgi:hypothetical protein